MKVILITVTAVVLCLFLSGSFGAKDKAAVMKELKNQKDRADKANKQTTENSKQQKPVDEFSDCEACDVLDITKDWAPCIKDPKDLKDLEHRRSQCTNEQHEICRNTLFPEQTENVYSLNARCFACLALARRKDFKKCIKETKDLEFRNKLGQQCALDFKKCVFPKWVKPPATPRP